MGPRLFSRGKRWNWSTPPTGPPRFNGAAAVQPRKETISQLARTDYRRLQWGRGCSAAERRSRPRAAGRHCGFNGAAAVQPRKGVPKPKVDATTVASMGPRLFSRGKVVCGGDLHRAGPRFNGAAAVQPRKDRSRHAQGASQRASMGPRLFSRGKVRRTSAHSRGYVLQWGRGCSAAESAYRTPTTSPPARCFNGAAAVQPRKAVLAPAIPRSPVSLQWGRGCSAAERRTPGSVWPWHCTLQWGRGCSAAERH